MTIRQQKNLILWLIMLSVGGLSYFSWQTPSANHAVIEQLSQQAAQNLSKQSSTQQISTHTDEQRFAIEQQQQIKHLQLDLSGDIHYPLKQQLSLLTAYCHHDTNCIEAIREQLNPEQQQQLRHIWQQQTLLEQRLANFPQSTNTDFAQRLAAISTLRQDILGKENAKLLYGQEEAILAYQAAVDSFIKTNARSLTLQARQQQLAQFKKDYLADYLPVLSEYRPQSYNRYLEDLAIAELDAKTTEQVSALRLKIRTAYFGSQQAEQMAQQDTWQQQQQQRMAQYQQAKQQLLAQYANNPNDSQYLAQLQQLRQHFVSQSSPLL